MEAVATGAPDVPTAPTGADPSGGGDVRVEVAATVAPYILTVAALSGADPTVVATAEEALTLTELADVATALMGALPTPGAGDEEDVAAILPKVQGALEAALRDIQRVVVGPAGTPSEEHVLALQEREQELLSWCPISLAARNRSFSGRRT